jgi:hypothetical protein
MSTRGTHRKPKPHPQQAQPAPKAAKVRRAKRVGNLIPMAHSISRALIEKIKLLYSIISTLNLWAKKIR